MIKRRTPKPHLRPRVSIKNALELAGQSKKHECYHTFKCIFKVPYETLIRFRNDMTETKTEREKSKLLTSSEKNLRNLRKTFAPTPKKKRLSRKKQKK